MAEWAREDCCSFIRCSRPSGSWRRLPAADPVERLAETSLCMHHWPHRRRHLQERWLSLDLLETSACACLRHWNRCLALAPAALPSRPVSAVDTTEWYQGLWVAAAETQVHNKIKDATVLEIDIHTQTVASKTVVLDIDQDTWPMHNSQAYVYGSKTNIYSKEIDKRRTLQICPTWHRSISLWNPPPEAHWNEQILLQVEKKQNQTMTKKMSRSDGWKS